MLRSLKVAALVLGMQLIGCNFSYAETFVKNCHMDYCRWFKITKHELIGRSTRGNLIKLRYKEWESHHPNGAYNKKFPKKYIGTTPAYMFCSKTDPAVIFQTGDNSTEARWDVTPLSPRYEDTIGGSNLLAHMLYFNACHGTDFERTNASFASLAKKFGYPKNRAEDSTYVVKDPKSLLSQ